MKSAKIRLLESQFREYTGPLCGVMFENGLSVSELSFIDQRRICASMRAETVDGVNVSISGAYGDNYSLDSGEAKRSEISAPEVNIIETKTQETQSKVAVYTREELEAVADSEGIAGLRVIGNSLGVKAKNIDKMISAIMSAQGGQ